MAKASWVGVVCRSIVSLVLLGMLVGCGVEAPSAPPPGPTTGGDQVGTTTASQHGLSMVLGNGNQAIFFNSKGSTLSKLQTVMAGGALDENWFLVEVPSGFMPSDDETKLHDLRTTAGITLTTRHLFTLNGKPHWQTLGFNSATPGVDGHLRISGSNVVAATKHMTLSGVLLGAGFQLRYQGPLKIAGANVPSDLDISKGFMFTPQQ